MLPSILPQPVKMEPGDSPFTLATGAIISAPPAALEVAELLAEWLRAPTGYAVPVHTGGPAGAIALELDATLAPLGPEGYHLDVSAAGARLRAAAPAGLFYAVQSLRQLFPAAIFARQPVSGVAWQAPGVHIEDAPRFAWRGAMLDVSRYFMPVAEVERYIDLLALHKFNVFHWHLTDDQGWRIEIRKYPRLTEIGAWRKQTMVGHMRRNNQTDLPYDGVPHGGFYTQAQIRQIVEYARRRQVRVLPEIEIPGHAQAAIAAYPELGCAGPQEVACEWGIHTYDVFNPFENTFQFLEDVFNEVMELFPGEFIHVGGDEVIKQSWQENPEIQARKHQLGLQDEHELQSYFIRRIEAVLQARGRRLVGWDEILEGGLAPNATVMSWRGETGGVAAAQAGHDVVMAPNTYTYFDYYQAADKATEPLAIGGWLPLSRVYPYNPVPAELTPAQAGHVLGTQFQIWTEYLPNLAAVEYMAFPRACALAEAAWCQPESKNWEAFTARLGAHLPRLDALQVHYRKAEWE